MLTAVSHAVPGVDDSPNFCIGSNVVSLFPDPGATTLNKVLGFADVSFLNPIIVQCKASGEPFYAIVHQATGCLVVDFEPVNPSEFPTAAVWASQTYKLAATAVSKIQSLPGGSMGVLCNTLVQEVFDLMGYDRVIVYKFHEDFHGEVICEITKPDLEPYLGLHYPATDIPQAARFLFMKNKVRMICDCRARSVKIIEDEDLPFHVSLCGSTLRAPHSCHLQYMKNMKSVASLVMAVVVNEDRADFVIEQQAQQQQRKKRCGLIVCHHGSPRYVPFALRHACEFIAQVFAVHLSKELEVEKQMQEKNVHRDSTSLSFDSLQDASYPGLASLASEIKWGGAKHDPSDKDDCRRMHPRLSFKAFLEVVRMKSLPWNDYEMDAINSLQLVIRGSLNDANKLTRVPHLNNQIGHLKPNAFAGVPVATSEIFLLMETATVPIIAVDGNGLVIGWNLKVAQMTGLRVDEAIGRHMLTLVEESSLPNVQRVLSLALQGIEEKKVRLKVKTHGSKKGDGPVIMIVNARTNRDVHEKVVGVCFVAQDSSVPKLSSEKNTWNEGENKVLVNNPNRLVPMTKLTGWHREEILHKMLLGEDFDSSNASCLLKDKYAFVRICILINSILARDQTENQAPFGFYGRKGWYIECLLSAKRKENADGVLTGVSFFILFPSHELQHALQGQQASEKTTLQRSRCLDLGIMYEFVLQDMVVAALSKVQTACQGKGVIVSCDLAEKFLKQRLYGDCIRLRKILFDFLFASVKFCPVGGSVAISSNRIKNSIGENIDLIDLELRIKEQVIAVPEEILAQMFQEDNEDQPEEGLTLVV
ncbi:Phytochrome a, partial [Dichanthelium oligosanthes]